jgi:S1-C subfamily serine protease
MVFSRNSQTQKITEHGNVSIESCRITLERRIKQGYMSGFVVKDLPVGSSYQDGFIVTNNTVATIWYEE